MDQFSDKVIDEIMKLEANSKCFDCGNSNPKWASLNNAIFVCLKCAGIHRSFGVNVSFIRSLTIDSWDSSQLTYLKLGGNQRFRDLLDEFKVPMNATMDFKYTIRASEYYRKLLKSEVNGEEPPFKPDIISGLEMLDFGIYSAYNERRQFDNNTPITNAGNINLSKGGFMSNVGSFFSKAKTEMRNMGEKVGSKIKEMEIGDKLKTMGERGAVYAKATGSLIVEKGKEVYVSII